MTSNLYLEIVGAANVSRIDLTGEPISIGRHADNRIVLDDKLASRAHAVIEPVGKDIRVRDLHSSNGTLVNGVRIHAVTLKPGDVIQIGRTQLKLCEVEPTLPPMEMLGEEDIIVVNDTDKMAIGNRQLEGDYEAGLETLADNLPALDFGEHEVALADARGRTVHEAGIDARPAGQRRDASGLFRLATLVSIRCHASDIHLEPKKEHYLLRMRVDGVMVDAALLPLPLGQRVAAVVKVLSGIDLAQRESIQEGHYSAIVPSANHDTGFRRIDYRVSFAPTVYGQKMVIRVLDPDLAPGTIRDLGLPTWMAREIANSIANDSGMVLVSGPTGSGKTTTLYALLRSIDSSQRNVVTIEDPVEIQLEGVSQIPVDDEHGKSFSALLRSVLRQDPDVILVGEIRDAETARTAIQAAVTGHLVFSTVHTRDSVGSVYRLLDLGAEPHMLSQGLHLVLAQRLVRQLCPYCRKAVKPTDKQLEIMGPKHAACPNIFEPAGCPKCLGTGFQGRRAVFELLNIDDRIRDIISSKGSASEVFEALEGTSFTRLLQSGYDLVARGLTSMNEVERAVGR